MKAVEEWSALWNLMGRVAVAADATPDHVVLGTEAGDPGIGPNAVSYGGLDEDFRDEDGELVPAFTDFPLS